MKTLLSCLIVADDFTGSCDTGLQFVQEGLRARVLIGSSLEAAADTDVLVWDTETRNSTAAAARRQVREACGHFKSVDARVWYKKIDSTLRGPFAAEIHALMEIQAFDLCLLAPAFPAAGRITVGGYHLLNGVPVARTEMGAYFGAPVRQSFVPRLFEEEELEVHAVALEIVAQGPERIIETIESFKGDGRRVVVLDAAAPEDLLHVVQAAAKMEPTPLLCGSAGLAAQVPGGFGLQSGMVETGGEEPVVGPVLIVAGSTQALTRKQLEKAQSRLDLEAWSMPEDLHRMEEIKSRFLNGGNILLSTSETQSREEMAQAVGSLAQTGRWLCEQVRPAGVVVTGGWTAVELLRQLEGEGVEILEKVDEGVPRCRLEGGPFQGLPLVTKAGALGGEEVFLEAVARLRREPVSARPLLGITMGDPCGVGPEVIVKALSTSEVYRICRPLVIGHEAFLEENLNCAETELSVCPIDAPEGGEYRPGRIDVWNPVEIDVGKIQQGRVCPEGGRGAVGWVKAAVDLALEDRIHGLVTAPLNKEAMNRAGYHYAGHTELLGDRTRTRNYRMMLASEQLKVVHVTTHMALNGVPGRLSVERVFDTIALAQKALEDLDQDSRRIAVAGLNPHAGESGLFGHEDAEFIRPAVEKARDKGWDVHGPLPGDTLFYRAQQGDFDLVVAMYHDQGHIPIKLVAFADAVNVTLGLPIVRTSVDHGTAFDIAGKGIADHQNMIQAIRMGARLATARCQAREVS